MAIDKQTVTPGPWKVDGDRDQDFGLCVVQESTGGVICEISSTLGYGTADELNARLIAAAPELLEALKAIFDGFVDGSIRFTKKRWADSDPHHPVNVLMCAAIEKAEGI
jgi:hypothetical protein